MIVSDIMHFKVYSRFFYSRLDEKSKSVYKKILQGWLEYTENIILIGSYKDVDFYKVFSGLRDDNPELFYVNLNSVLVCSSSLQTIIKAKFNYGFSEIENIKKRINNIILDFKKSNQFVKDKEKAIHDFLALNVTYSSDLYTRNAHNIYGPFIEKSAVCEGYAYAFKLLCDEMQVPCIIVHGTAQGAKGRSENHAWNIVQVNNINYHVDVTWDSDSMKKNGSALYYNVSESFIRKDHVWDIKEWPRCQTLGELEKKIIYADSFESLCDKLRYQLKNKEKQIVIKSIDGIASTSGASQMINKVFCKIKANIHAYSIAYMENLDYISLIVDYSR